MKRKPKKPSIHFSQKILSFLHAHDHPIKQEDLKEKINTPLHLEKEFQEALNLLLAQQEILQKGPYLLAKNSPLKENIFQARISTHPRGFGFAQIEGKELPEVFIPEQATLGAIDGDLVWIFVTGKENPKGWDGQVLEIIERKSRILVGTILGMHHKGYLLFVPSLGKRRKVVAEDSRTFSIGDRVTIHLSISSDSYVMGTILDKFGHSEDPSSDIPFGVKEFGIATVFPQEALLEAQKKHEGVPRKDLRNEDIFTIDPEDSKDHDDALSISFDGKEYILGVHIADVSFFVKDGSALDIEAKKRGNSTYFPGKCIPMLPEALSSDLCSLKEGVDRFAVSIMMRFDANGRLITFEHFRSVIRVCKRFSYGSAFAVIEKREKSPHQKKLQTMVDLALLLKQERKNRGSIDLSMKEARLCVDEEGNPTGVSIVEYDISHQLVEEFMLKTNEIVAKILLDRGVKSLFRVHEAPLEKSLEEFLMLARRLGFTLPPMAQMSDLKTLFTFAAKSPYLEQLSVAFIRSMRLAFYSEENVGHFGLCLPHYSHFTSPIRRYSDLIVHRILLENSHPAEMKEIAKHCSHTERVSFRAESRVVQIKKLRLLSRWKKEGKTHFDGYISKIKPYGVHFELADLMFEGFLKLEAMGQDFYTYLPKENAFIGKRTKERISIGNKISVILCRIDLDLIEADFIKGPSNVR